jgi:subtilisin family serine protease
VRRRRLLALSLLAVGLLTSAGAAASASRGTPTGSAKVDPRVVRRIAQDGETTFWVVVRGRANLSKARGIQDWGDRGRYVYERLVHEADATQSGLRSQLKKLGVQFQPYWIANVIRVTAGDAVLKQLAADPQVERIEPDRTYHVEKPRRARDRARALAVEWGVSRINAPQVWSTYGDTGQGIVIASIDTGTQFDHPALAQHYRGSLGGGQYDHNYNWYDPSSVCATPSRVPCDNNGHGTHTMGTMVGDDGAGNQIGVAPGARWITAKGCESSSCSSSALVSSGQWMLAPTDVNGQNPRTDLRPNIVSNSWGGGPGASWYQQVVDAWVAAGIFPVFANGNSGPGCGTAGSPGDYLNTYAVGAFDSSNAIASFSSRGPSAFGSETKPNISAPGVGVRSSVPTNGYASYSGTSMATPHVAAAVALLWAAAPSLVGQIGQTRQLLDSTAIDVSDLSCGGTASDNDVWGEGRLDAYAAVTAAPRGSTGTLAGTVTVSGSSTPIAGAQVDVTTGPTTRTTYTDAGGHYQLTLSVGTYSVAASSFGRVTQTATGVVLTQGQTTTRDFALAAAPAHSVTGVVRAAGSPVANATVTILNTPIPSVTTNGSGVYSFASVPDGTYSAQAQFGRCTEDLTKPLVVSGDTTLDFALTPKTDGTYTCSIQAASYVAGTTATGITGDDASGVVSLPSPFTFYGQTYSSVNVSTNGFLDFAAPNSAYTNGSLPSAAQPNLSAYPYWDDLYVDGSAAIRTATLSSPSRFVIDWSNVTFFGDTSRRLSFEAVLYLGTGEIVFQYSGLGSDARKQGNSTTVGVENATGSAGIQYSYNEAVLSDSQAISFGSSASPVITTSTVHDATRGQSYSPSVTLAATGGTAPYTWSLASGSLPSGLSLSTGGLLSGTVSGGASLGTASFTVQVTDSASKTATKGLSVDVRDPVGVTTTSLAGGSVGSAYSQSLAATGGKTPYTWSVVAGSLPPGLAVTGASIVGTPSATGTYAFTVQAADAGNPARTATQPLSITITGGTVPSAPRNVSAASARSGGVQLSWSAPSSSGGSAITGYRIYRSTSSGAETFLTSVSTLSYRDTATTRRVRYYYKVGAVNGTGEGPLSSEVSAMAK